MGHSTHFSQRFSNLLAAYADAPQHTFKTAGNGISATITGTPGSQEFWTDAQACANTSALRDKLEAMWRGDRVNTSEDRQVLHWLARAPDPLAFNSAGIDVALFSAQRQRLFEFVGALEKGCHPFSGDKVEQIVQLGMGGSIHSARLACNYALGEAQPEAKPQILCYSGADLQQLRVALAGFKPQNTMVIYVSKSGTTRETALAFDLCKDWLGDYAMGNCIAVSTDPVACSGLEESHIIGMSPAVGGRYSIWSSAGIGAALALGSKGYADLLAGGAEVDADMRQGGGAYRLALRLAIADAWYRLHHKVQLRILLTYNRALSGFTEYVQQLDMESLGKPGEAPGACGPTMGGYGCDAAHSYMQWLFQAPARFHLESITWPAGGEDAELARAQCYANERLVREGGKGVLSPLGDVRGGQPTTLIEPQQAGHHALGALLALYEYRTILQGWMWGVNPFDQYGVELAKTRTAAILKT